MEDLSEQVIFEQSLKRVSHSKDFWEECLGKENKHRESPEAEEPGKFQDQHEEQCDQTAGTRHRAWWERRAVIRGLLLSSQEPGLYSAGAKSPLEKEKR